MGGGGGGGRGGGVKMFWDKRRLQNLLSTPRP